MSKSSELSIIVPTFNEADNIEKLVSLLSETLSDKAWEVVFVDDNSPDATSSLVRRIAQEDSRVRCIQRYARRGLSSAVIEGILSTSSPYLCVMDADLQHDETLIPDMLASIKTDIDLAIASRYIENASTGELSENRVKISKAATYMGNLILEKHVSDPMSGFFMIRRQLFEKVVDRLSGKGFKILLDIIASIDNEVSIKEFPYEMRKREHGESKLSATVIWEFFSLITNKLFGKYLPLRFVMFVSVGFSGILVHTLALYIAHKLFDIKFSVAQLMAIIVAMTSNYLLNNLVTFNEHKHAGFRLIPGLLSFYLACSVGALINITVATVAFNNNVDWWVSGIMGAIAGALWNFALVNTITWKTHKSH